MQQQTRFLLYIFTQWSAQAERVRAWVMNPLSSGPDITMHTPVPCSLLLDMQSATDAFWTLLRARVGRSVHKQSATRIYRLEWR